MARSKEMLIAKSMRQKGESIKDIAYSLKVSVSSVSNWCRNIELTDQQKNNLARRVTDPYYGKKAEYLERSKEQFKQKVENLRKQGIKEVSKLSKREIFLIGIALYWGEGFKKDHQVGFANTDSKMIKFFIYWLKTCFNLRNKDLIVRVTSNDQYKDKIKIMEAFWSNALHIPLNQFSKPFFQKTIWKKQYENPTDYHGVLRIKVRKSVNLLRKIYGHIEGLTLNVTS